MEPDEHFKLLQITENYDHIEKNIVFYYEYPF